MGGERIGEWLVSATGAVKQGTTAHAEVDGDDLVVTERVIAVLNGARLARTGEEEMPGGGPYLHADGTPFAPAVPVAAMPAPSSAAELAARILVVWDGVRQMRDRDDMGPDARVAGLRLRLALKRAWESLMDDPDEVSLAAARAAVEEAERLVGEGG